MSEQEFLRPASTSEDVDQDTTATAPAAIDIADLLDKIDGVLEKNAQEFVDNFIQKGGQ